MRDRTGSALSPILGPWKSEAKNIGGATPCVGDCHRSAITWGTIRIE
jgi:hypothetical protein